ncbi:TPA: biotin--[acetyl-CoA-carboxylase] ligase [Candidatus Dependentiae bacterium]|nr:MAG: Biotin-protein ligase [candidate division TM6 bacterium GW2011_GWE2_31_21]KKP53473.1 MAG: Biotin-protein ligase [candidate division TM6 bacterium GW2011_GWF2_33_332]HBS48285.1 biotin--[acetyl-CoA-carboxylase] ligase [Candidatus Dependentiae bacterium]HBZ73712.1 biotin--[acetyl-CoA-carboxylase] ligase [Candidatus Dependentiae bacterium]
MVIGNKILYQKSCKSSLDWAKSNIETAGDGTVFLTDFIENAKGRGNRVWQCFEGQAILTILLKPQITYIDESDLENKINSLTMAFSLGVVNALQEHNIKIKWPNDFMLNNKKLGGMLVEIVWEKNLPKAIIIGIALNINNSFPPNDELYKIATSLKDLLNKIFDLKTIIDNCLCEIDKLYSAWKDKKFDLIYKNWKTKQLYLNQKIKVHQNDGSFVEGIAKDFATNGDLILTDENNNEQRISFYQVENVELRR